MKAPRQSVIRLRKSMFFPVAPALLTCLFLAIWPLMNRLHDPARATHPFRIGFQQSPPLQVVTPGGLPSGPAIEIISEAARRRHIPLEWVLRPDGPDDSFLKRNVDLWP